MQARGMEHQSAHVQDQEVVVAVKPTAKQELARVASDVGRRARGQCEKVAARVWRNKATYAFFAAHAGALVAFLCAYQLDATGRRVLSDARPPLWVPLAIGGVVHYLLLGRHLKNSYFQGARFEREAEFIEQPKILNTANWVEKNGVIINDEVYSSGYQLWRGYETSTDKALFLRQFLSVVAIDSSATKTRQVIVAAIEQLKQKLAECSEPGHERYTNAGLLLGRWFYPIVYPGKKKPANIETWLWQEERGGDLFKKPLGEGYFEEWLNKGFLEGVVRVYETDMLARMFSLTDCRKSVGSFVFPWYRVSSWSRNGAAHYYVALLKQYVFLLSCRALCDQIISSKIVDQKQDVYW